VSESDEMALVGVLSVMLLDDLYVTHPALARPAEPNKVVIGAALATPTPSNRDGGVRESASTAPVA
jgi:hypothetical protein